MSQVKHFEMPDGTIVDVPTGGGEGSSVIPNPEDLSEEAIELTSLRIDNQDFKVLDSTLQEKIDNIQEIVEDIQSKVNQILDIDIFEETEDAF